MSGTTNDLGKWHTTLAAVISTLAPTGDKYLDDSAASVFGNGQHNAIIQVKLELGDADSNPLTKSDIVSPAAVKRSIKLGNYDDSGGFTELGGGATAGWKVEGHPSVFLCPPIEDDTPLPTISPSIYRDGPNEDNLYCIHFFVSYDETLGNGPGTFEMGIEVQPKDSENMPQGKKFKVSKTSGDDPYILIALKSLSIGVDDFEWKGSLIHRDGQSDDYVPPNSGELDVNYFREISYTVALRDGGSYPASNKRYGSKIFRCGIDDGHSYSPRPVNGYKDYSFGLRRNNFYSFRGYFWPYNVYKESVVTNVAAQPLVPPPTDPAAPNPNFRMIGNAVEPLTPTLTYNSHSLYLSLFMTFGFASNNYDQSCSLDINVYDQYGHKGDLAVDPGMLPNKYVDPESDDGLCSLKYFSTNTEIPDEDDTDNQKNVYGMFVAKLRDAGKYRYIAVDETESGTCQVILKETPDDKLPDFDKTNLFRPFRSTKTNNSPAAEINYSIVSYDYKTVEWAVFGPHVVTTPTIRNIAGWRLAPVWINTSFIIYFDANSKVVTSEMVDGDNVLRLKDNPTGSASLEWEFVVCADTIFRGAPDKGQGPNEEAFNTPNPTSGRNYWVTINSLKMSLSGGMSTGYIYPNGLNQAEINIEFAPGDGKGNPLDNSQFPTIPYIKSCIVAADYHTGKHFNRELNKPGWDFSFDSNEFQKHTSTPGSIVADYDDIEVSINESSKTINIVIYVTAERAKNSVMDVGLWIGIHDEVWGDPVVYTCMEGDSGGDTFNFDTFVSINLKNSIAYKDSDLLLTPANASRANRSDSWPVSTSTTEVDDNMWRLWNFSIGLNGPIQPLFFAVDTKRYSKNTRCFSTRSCGVYTASAYIWPTGLLDMETLKPIPESSVTSFSVDSAYSVSVQNTPNTGNLYMSVYWEFGSGDYSNTVLQNYFTIVLYDVFGNKAEFNPDPGLIQEVYQESGIKNSHPLNSGPAIAKNEYSQSTVCYSLISECSKAGENRYATFQNYRGNKETYDVVIQQKTDRSTISLDYLSGKTYRFLFGRWEDYAMGARYKSEDNELFAGKPLSSRFDFYLRPVWNKKGFLIATSVPGEDTDGKAFAYLEDETPIVAELKDVLKDDDSFIWKLEFF